MRGTARAGIGAAGRRRGALDQDGGPAGGEVGDDLGAFAVHRPEDRLEVDAVEVGFGCGGWTVGGGGGHDGLLPALLGAWSR